MLHDENDDTGTVIMWRVPAHVMKWKDLYDKNIDKLHVSKQLLPKSEYDTKHKKMFDNLRKIVKTRWCKREL